MTFGLYADVRFEPAAEYPTGGHSTGAFTADLDGDGDVDYAIANRTANSVTVWFNNGLGVFENRVDFATGLNPRYVDGYDFDGDGDVDLCTPDYYGHTVTILENDGIGNFSISQQFEMFTPTYVWIDDIDLDGKQDIIVLHWDADAKGSPHQSPGKITPLYSNGDGTFEQGESAFIGVEPRGGASGDLNNDGLIDIVTADIYSQTISIVLSNGVRSWDERIQISMPTGWPRYISLGDFDSDGDLDIAALDKLADQFWLLKNDGSAQFVLEETLHINDAPHSMAVIDVEGDGDLDFVVSHVGAIVQLILYNDGTGHVESRQGVIIPGGAAEIKLSDFNNDGLFDILAAGVNQASPGSLVLLQEECNLCEDGVPCPPQANDIVIFTDSYTPIEIQLEGVSDTTNQLDYFITSLPISGVLIDETGVEITYVPYYLPSDTIEYIPVNSFVGLVTIDYFTNDCLLSNQALVKVYVDPVFPDECDESLEVFNGYTPIYNVNATDSVDPYDLSICEGIAGSELRNDIWIHYFACENGELTIDTCGLLDFDSTVIVYEGNCCNLNQIACNLGNETCGGNSIITVDGVDAGKFYFIRIGSSSISSAGGGQVYINGPSVGCVESCFTDLTSDGTVDVSDLLLVLEDWGNNCGFADLNLDGIVDVVDLLAVIGDWGACGE